MADRYLFQSQWRLPADPDLVYAALADVARYPLWWPQIRRARRIDEKSGELTCRSLLPFDMVFQLTSEIEDARARVLRARMTGDLNGTSQWTVHADRSAPGAGSLAVFDENIGVGMGALRAAGRLLRPAMRLNHELMMRSGERGLRTFLKH